MDYKTIGVALKYTPLKELIKKEGWYIVEDADGKMHWIYEALVAEEYLCAVVVANVANLRSGPGKEYETVYNSPVYKNDCFKILNEYDSWVNVEYEFNVTGWIFRTLLRTY